MFKKNNSRHYFSKTQIVFYINLNAKSNLIANSGLLHSIAYEVNNNDN